MRILGDGRGVVRDTARVVVDWLLYRQRIVDIDSCGMLSK